MAQGSGVTLRLSASRIPYHPEAMHFAELGLIPAGAYRNREYAEAGVNVVGPVSRAMQDILYDPQTSGGLLAAVPAAEAADCLAALQEKIPDAAVVGTAEAKGDHAILLEK